MDKCLEGVIVHSVGGFVVRLKVLVGLGFKEKPRCGAGSNVVVENGFRIVDRYTGHGLGQRGLSFGRSDGT